MFDVATIQAGFSKILGWRNSSDPDVPQITNPDLLATDSGLYYNDYHPLIDMENISNTIPETKDLEEYLQEKVDAGVVKVFNKFALWKKEMNSTKTILNSSAMFEGVARFSNSIANESKFVGMKVKLKESYGVRAKIDRLGLQFTAAQTNLPIYVFHSSQESYVQRILVTTTKVNSMEWVTLSEPINLSYYGANDVGGFYYIGYYQDDILGQALKKDFNWTRFCAGCAGRQALKIWNTRLHFMEVEPFYVADGKLSCQLYQRSADIFLGVPFNIASYALLTMMVAQVTCLTPGDFIHTFGDAHLYLSHVEQAREQLSRTPYGLPEIHMNPHVTNIFDFKFEDFELIGYQAHPHIKAKVSV